jgi:hypothetical protein
MKTLPHFVNLETAARMAGVTRRTVQNKLAFGQIPAKAIKLEGRVKLISLPALEAVFGKLSSSRDEKRDEVPGNFHRSFHENNAAQLAAKDQIIASLQATLEHERRDREHERLNWQKALHQSQANLLAAQDTPTARALAGVPRETAIIEEPRKPKPRPRKTKPAPWWRSIFAK